MHARVVIQAGKKRTERVFLEAPSVIHRAHNKLTFKFYGMYTILQKIGYIVCKLELWVFSRIHPMFQMSQLKQFMPPTVQLIRWLQGYLLLMLMWRFLLRFFALVSGNGIIVQLLKFLSNGAKLILSHNLGGFWVSVTKVFACSGLGQGDKNQTRPKWLFLRLLAGQEWAR